ncbi:MAG: hypothetical protein GIW95_12190, partial [Candidatus Eremiobacteraeota bacterium]|nr:hypothetical protein [Candidatus Eremiobacteraeota bacterium]
MERVGNRLVYSASDLVDFVACRHLSVLEALVADSLEQRPAPSAEDQLVFAAGRAHEADYLAALSDGRRS